MNTKSDSRFVLRRIFASKKLMFVCLAYTVTLISSVVRAFQNKPNLTNFQIFGFEINLGYLLGQQIADILNGISNLLFAFSLLSLVPLALFVVGFWLLRCGKTALQSETKKALIGSNFLKIFSLYHYILYSIAWIGALILSIFWAYIAAFEIKWPPLPLAIGVFVVVLVIGVLKTIADYHGHAFSLLVDASVSLRSGVNVVLKYKGFVFYTWFAAIVTIIDAIGTDILGMVLGALSGAALICIALCIQEYYHAIGTVSKDEKKEIVESFAKNPQMNEIFGLDNNKKMGYLFGTESFISLIEDMENEKEVPVYAAATEQIPISEPMYQPAPTYREPVQMPLENHFSATASKVSRNTYAYHAPVRRMEYFMRVLPLFGDDIDEQEARYQTIHTQICEDAFSCPIRPHCMKILLDAFSEKTLLRMAWNNQTTSSIKKIRMDITIVDAETEWISKDMEFLPKEGAFLANFGLVLPDDAEACTICVTYVEFEDGLFWDKGGASISFACKEAPVPAAIPEEPTVMAPLPIEEPIPMQEEIPEPQVKSTISEPIFTDEEKWDAPARKEEPKKKRLFVVDIVLIAFSALMIIAWVWFLFSWLGGNSSDYKMDDDGATYSSLSSKDVMLSSGSEAWVNSSIPSDFNGKTVTAIGGNACRDYDNLESILIPGTVQSIGPYAFYDCDHLTDVYFNGSLTSIEAHAFAECDNLKNIVISNVEHIGEYAFYNCGSLSSLTISSENIGDRAFSSCSRLTSVTILDGAKSIGNSAFCDCSGLTSITIPSSVTSIGASALNGCTSLQQILFEGTQSQWNAITKGTAWDAYIGDYTMHFLKQDDLLHFSYDTTYGGYVVTGVNERSITSVTIPSSYEGKPVTAIGDYAFRNCYNLSSITIPNSVTNIGNEAFYGCDSLTSITIPDSVTSIGNYAFYGCDSLSTITIPNSVTSIGDDAFCGCASLSTITIPNSVTSIGDYAFQYCASLTSITIPNSVTSIGKGAFYSCASLRSITIPDSVTSIGNGAFYNCDSLVSITIPDSVASIDNSAFQDCDNLSSITIPNSVTRIGDYVFYDCDNLSTITIPNSVTRIGDGAFCYCISLTSITFEGTQSQWNAITKGTAWDSFTGDYTMHFLKQDDLLHFSYDTTYGGYVVTGVKERSITSVTIPSSYEGKPVTAIGNQAFYDCDRLTNITIPNSVTSIGNEAFSGCASLTSITIPNSVTSIVYGAFQNCASLRSITIPNSVTSIGNYAFCGCASLSSITIPNSVTSIGDHAFYDCDSLSSITIPNSVTSIGKGAFYSCASLTSITIPNSVTSIGNSAFWDCASLTSITIPNSVTSIGNGAFRSCDSLSSITIPNSVTSIGEGAFYNCDNLTSITIPNSVTSIGDYAFSYCHSLLSITFEGTQSQWNAITKGTAWDSSTWDYTIRFQP